MSMAITGGKVLLSDGSVEATGILVADGRIEALDARARGDTTLDAAGAAVLPGIIDIHTHAIGRESCASESLEEYARLEAEHGATTFFPTLFGPVAQSVAQLVRHSRAMAEGIYPQVGGFRLESPYLARTGGGAAKDMAPISAETTDALLGAGSGRIRIWDVSPELPGASELIRRLSGAGILCSLAHTHATIEQARAAVDAGARLVTHLFDTFAAPPMVDAGVYPAGLVDYLLVEDRVCCEIIGDGTHVHPLLVEQALRCKTPGRLAWVTDSNFGAGLPPGAYDAPGWGWIVVNGPSAGARLRDRGMDLAGSALTPIDAFCGALRLFHQDVATASVLCARTPARLMGLNKGEISVGRDADFIIVDDGWELLYTIVAGKIVFAKG
jgi:N-acetylglucosamine-6-phosphate deacetylase